MFHFGIDFVTPWLQSPYNERRSMSRQAKIAIAILLILTISLIASITLTLLMLGVGCQVKNLDHMKYYLYDITNVTKQSLNAFDISKFE